MSYPSSDWERCRWPCWPWAEVGRVSLTWAPKWLELFCWSDHQTATWARNKRLLCWAVECLIVITAAQPPWTEAVFATPSALLNSQPSFRKTHSPWVIRDRLSISAPSDNTCCHSYFVLVRLTFLLFRWKVNRNGSSNFSSCILGYVAFHLANYYIKKLDSVGFTFLHWVNVVIAIKWQCK